MVRLATLCVECGASLARPTESSHVQRILSIPAGLARALGVLAPVLVALGGPDARAASATSPGIVAAQLRDAAMAGHNIAYSWVSELTMRFGPRPAGSA